MDEFDPAGALRKLLGEAEYRLLEHLQELPAAAMQALRDKVDEEIRQATATVKQRADQLMGILSRVPHKVGEVILAQFLVPATARFLTKGEVAHVREAFGPHALPLAMKGIVSYGPGKNPAAMIAFLNGNPAITIGNIMYFQPAFWKPDYAAVRENVPILLHEFTHVIQWDRIGHAQFLNRYRREKKAAGSANEMYQYRHRHTDFGHEMLEGQAQMVEDYTKYRIKIPLGEERNAADLKRRLTGSGIYGL